MLTEVETYDFFKEKLALKEKDARRFAQEFISYGKNLRKQVDEQIDKKFVEYQNIFATKEDIANLRTELKQDNANLRTELKGEISDLRVEFRTEMKQLKVDMIRWNFIFWAALGGLIAILKFFG